MAGFLTSHDSLRPGSGAYREGSSLGESSGQRRAQSTGMTGILMLQSSLGFPLALQPTCLSLFALHTDLRSLPPVLFLVPSEAPHSGIRSFCICPLISGLLVHLDCLLETWSHYVSLPDLELAMQSRVDLNSRRSACFCHTSVGVKGMHYHTQLL